MSAETIAISLTDEETEWLTNIVAAYPSYGHGDEGWGHGARLCRKLHDALPVEVPS